MADNDEDGIVGSNQELFNSSDMTMRYGPYLYNLHPATMCPGSKWFSVACDGEFKTAKIILNDDDPFTVNRMLIYLYTRKYPDGKIPVAQKPSEFHGPPRPPHFRFHACCNLIA
ncbi:hypothetical protein ABVK25_007518 [Lepraria finkii]|uniref:BTB domain-containing protein n=1 Tax=Lepraria finkii TaxID=1340010 RepID=A0ABR4B2D0_9LECA